MAIFNPGVAIGQISGRVGGSVFSHNKGGAYIRNGAMPVRVVSESALNLKAALTAASQGWQNLTAAQRLLWQTWANSQVKTNRLGRNITLTGQNWYVALNSRLLFAAESAITAPPSDPPPAPPVITAFTVDIGAGDVEVAFTPTPLGANNRLWVRAAMTPSSAVKNVQNLYTTAIIGTANDATPLDLATAMADVLGTLTVGFTYHIETKILDKTTGHLSSPAYASAVCVTT